MAAKVEGIFTAMVVPVMTFLAWLTIFVPACGAGDSGHDLRRFNSESAACDSLLSDVVRMQWLQDSNALLRFRAQIVRQVMLNRSAYNGINKECVIRLFGKPTDVVGTSYYYLISKRRLNGDASYLRIVFNGNEAVLNVYVIRE